MGFLAKQIIGIPCSQIKIELVFSLVDSFKTFLFVGGKHGSDYYWGETLAWWLVCQLQVKFKLETILESGKAFGIKELQLDWRT